MELVLVLTILLSIFGGVIGRFIPFNYFDELVFAIFLIVGLFQILFNKKRIPHNLKKGLAWFVFYLLMCLISTLVYRYQTNPVAILKDIVAIMKFPIIICFGTAIFSNGGISKHSKHNLLTILKIATVIIFAFSLVNFVIDIGMSTEIRHGLRTYKFLFSHETLMVSSVAIIMAILATEKLFSKYMLMNLIVLFASGRDKAYILIIVYLLVLLISGIKSRSNKKAFIFWVSIPIVLFVVFFTYDKIVNGYIQYGTQTARLAFIIHGFEFANDSFPLGTGFATWANSPSGEYYSVLYHIKNMETIYGIEFEGNSSITYWNDVFWPSIYTQGGYLGLFGYVAMLFMFIKEFLHITKKNAVQRNALIVLLSYVLMASLLESYFTNDAGVTVALVLVLVFGKPRCYLVRSGVKQNVPTLTSQEGECA